MNRFFTCNIVSVGRRWLVAGLLFCLSGFTSVALEPEQMPGTQAAVSDLVEADWLEQDRFFTAKNLNGDRFQHSRPICLC